MDAAQEPCSLGDGESSSVSDTTTLDRLSPGMRCKVLEIGGGLRSRQKFADVGLIEGAHIRFDGRSPFGGLIRVKVMGTNMSFHVEEAKHFIVKLEK